MGQEIFSSCFSPDDFERFGDALRDETTVLKTLFEENRFAEQPYVGGFELEAWLVNQYAQPVPDNKQFLERLANPEVVPELSLFNFEINVEPHVLKGGALARFHQNLKFNWEHCRREAAKDGDNVLAIGVHPDIRADQLIPENMSQSQRYRALNEQIFNLRKQKPLNIDIRGKEKLALTHDDVMLEAATTSFQIHLQVTQDRAARVYNAAQIVSAPLIAVSANAPYLFGKDLYAESRIPLFEQSVDLGRSYRQRVTFGSKYAKSSLFECFQENLDEYPVLIPENHLGEEGRFAHLRLHNGTIWRWNRPLLGFDSKGVPHLRIENRVVPSGPTVLDMMANAAFYWGLIQSFSTDDVPPESLLSFSSAKKNFYFAAKDGLSCDLKWLDRKTHSCANLVLEVLLPLAHKGLGDLGIDAADREHYLNIIEQRVNSGQNGAVWQRRWVEKHGFNTQKLSAAYLERQCSEMPVHEWPV